MSTLGSGKQGPNSADKGDLRGYHLPPAVNIFDFNSENPDLTCQLKNTIHSSQAQSLRINH